MKKETNYILICIIILVFFAFFIFTEFILSPCCLGSKEGFNTNCIGPNVIYLTDILLDDLDSITKISQINQIKFNTSESGNFKPILLATVKNVIPDIHAPKNISDVKNLKNGVSSSSSDLDPDLKIEYLKQKIMKVYILNCKDTNYNSISQIQDIKYLNSNNPEIQKTLKSKRDPSYKVLDIETILENQNNPYI